MKFILKDGLIHIVDNRGFYNNNIEVEIEIPELEPTRVDYKIAGMEYRTLKDNKIIILKDFLNFTKLEIVVRVFVDKDIYYFKSDEIPLTQAVLFGGTIDRFYPEIIKDLQKKYEKIEKYIDHLQFKTGNKLRETTTELNKKMTETQTDLKNTMVELVDTFEEITRKGSLF